MTKSSIEHARIFVGLARRQDLDGEPLWETGWLVETLAAAFDQVRAEEREACAKLVDNPSTALIAAAIRARASSE